MMQYAKIKDFTDLVAWQRAHALVLLVYKLARGFPNSEQYILTAQVTRAAVSITSNIAEGFGRSTQNDKAHFYSFARASAFEIRSQMRVARDLGYISTEEFETFERCAIEVTRLTAGIIRSTKT